MAALGFALFLVCMALSGALGSDLELFSSPRILDSITALNQKDVESSTPLTMQAENEQPLVYISHKMADVSEALRKEFQALLSNHSLRVEQNLRNQSLLIVKLSKQLEDVQTRQALLDATFTLRAHFDEYYVSNVSCASEEHAQKIDFFRVLDTGTGGALPAGARTYSRGRAAVLDLSAVPNGYRRGVYSCAIGNRTRMTFVINRLGNFVRPLVASLGEDVPLGGWKDAAHLRWLHDGQRVQAWDGRGRVEITGVGSEDAGFYELYEEGDRRRFQWFFRLVVRGCPAGFFGERCDQECRTCFNGGVCHERLGTCICAQGFEGKRCEEASEACDGGDCNRQLFCKQDPFGCSCAAGYWIDYCSMRCRRGSFGADCKQSCHCKEGSCDSYTGDCSGGCSPGWTGPSCQILVEN